MKNKSGTSVNKSVHPLLKALYSARLKEDKNVDKPNQLTVSDGVHDKYSKESKFTGKTVPVSLSSVSTAVLYPQINAPNSLKVNVKSNDTDLPPSYFSGSTSSESSLEGYKIGKIIGNGSFGVVCEAIDTATNKLVAIKKVLQDPRYKNRELSVLKELCHPNIVTLLNHFYTKDMSSNDISTNTSSHMTSYRNADNVYSKITQKINAENLLNGAKEDCSDSPPSQTSIYLNVVMEYIPDTVHKVVRFYERKSQYIPLNLVRIYMYQILRSIGYLHSLGICHRDIKPQNLLVDTKTHVLKLCDFGSAKRLVKNEQSVAYICSRFYRAPELMLGATEYTPAIDLWSIGCVLGELLLGKPLFPGKTSVDQIVQIIQVLGTPSKSEINAMNSKINFSFPLVKPSSWKKVFVNQAYATKEVLQVLGALLVYDPSKRVKPHELLTYPFFEPLLKKQHNLKCPLPPLFDFTAYEKKNYQS